MSIQNLHGRHVGSRGTRLLEEAAFTKPKCLGQPSFSPRRRRPTSFCKNSSSRKLSPEGPIALAGRLLDQREKRIGIRLVQSESPPGEHCFFRQGYPARTLYKTFLAVDPVAAPFCGKTRPTWFARLPLKNGGWFGFIWIVGSWKFSVVIGSGYSRSANLRRSRQTAAQGATPLPAGSPRRR